MVRVRFSGLVGEERKLRCDDSHLMERTVASEAFSELIGRKRCFEACTSTKDEIAVYLKNRASQRGECTASSYRPNTNQERTSHSLRSINQAP